MTENNIELPKIIYILAGGHSGTSVFDMFLNKMPHCWTTGEAFFALQDLQNQRKNRSRHFCGCGKEIKNCLIWESILEEVKKQEKKLNINWNPTHSLKFKDRIKDIFHIIKRKKIKPSKNECLSHKIFLNAVSKIGASEKGENIKFIIDSSKGMRRALHLMSCKKIEVILVHLIKDPRAWTYSFIKKKENSYRKLITTLKKSIEYPIMNKLMDKLCNILPKNKWIRIHYENFASNPREVLNLISEKFDIQKPKELDLKLKPSHGFLGNQARLKAKRIKIDKKWKSEMDPLYKNLVAFLDNNWINKCNF